MTRSVIYAADKVGSHSLTPFGRSVKLIATWMLTVPITCVAGTTAGISAPYLDELLVQLILYPYLSVAFAFIIFKISNRLWVFLFAPLLFWAFFSLAPLDAAIGPPNLPPLFGGAWMWLYCPHFVAFLAAYVVSRRSGRIWPVFLAPIFAWTIQIGILAVIAS